MAAPRGGWNLQYGLLVALSIAFFCIAATSFAYYDEGLAFVSLIGALVTAAAGLRLRPKEGRATEGCLLGAAWLVFGFLAVTFSPLTGRHGDRDSAYRTACLSHIKQLALAMIIYTVDYDDRFPLAESWQGALPHFVKDDYRFHCPVATSAWSYALDSPMAGIRMESVKEPEKQVLLFEANAALPNASGGREWLAPRHKAGKDTVANIGFVDFHVKHFTFAKAATLKW